MSKKLMVDEKCDVMLLLCVNSCAFWWIDICTDFLDCEKSGIIWIESFANDFLNNLDIKSWWHRGRREYTIFKEKFEFGAWNCAKKLFKMGYEKLKMLIYVWNVIDKFTTNLLTIKFSKWNINSLNVIFVFYYMKLRKRRYPGIKMMKSWVWIM